MKITVKSDLPELQRRMDRARLRIQREKPKMLQLVANTLKRLATDVFTKLSRGGTAIGIKWLPLSPAYKRWKEKRGYSTRIGIRKGVMRQSHRTEIAAIREVSLEYEVREGTEGNYAISFDRRRTLLPDEAPPAWLKEIEPKIEEWATGIFLDELKEMAT